MSNKDYNKQLVGFQSGATDHVVKTMKFLSKYDFTGIIVILTVCILIRSDSGAFGNKKLSKNCCKKSFVQLIFTRNNTIYNMTNNRKGLCRWLKGLKHQSRLCLRRKGLANVIRDTKLLTLNSCRHHFQYEQWPCLRLKKFFKKIYRETAFVYSLTTSAFMFLVAKGCAAGNLDSCKCANHGMSDNVSTWQWGGCGDNTKFAKSFTYKFFQLRKTGDKAHNILRYNSEMGIQVVMRNEEKICKCHGLSGSCTFKICFKRIRPFANIVEELKNRYHSAIQVDSDNSVCELRKEGVADKLIYLERSPNFCPSTVGRRCKDADNCATLCCGRGFGTEVVTVKEACKCRWRNESLYELTCQQCEKEQNVFKCH